MNLVVSTKEAKKGFYPTPPDLAAKLLEGVKISENMTILEPSAGTGNLIMALAPLMYTSYYGSRCACDVHLEVDCCEIDPALRGILMDNFSEDTEHNIEESIKTFDDIHNGDDSSTILKQELREMKTLLRNTDLHICHDSFLTYQTQKAYDLILMNPPFADGDAHLLKAIAMQERYGGKIRCILNAETLRNPCTNRRKTLMQKLRELNAEITYETGAFQEADRATDVDVAIIKIDIPKPELHSDIWEHCKKAQVETAATIQDPRDLVISEKIGQILARYQTEVSAGIKLIQEYMALQPYIMPEVKPEKYSKPLIELSVKGNSVDSGTINKFIRAVRRKYWSALFSDKQFTGQLTSNLRDLLDSRIKEMVDYEFSEYNIRVILAEMNACMVQGVQETIMDNFELLTVKYAYGEFGSNIHYYNGWKTNKAWKIGKKVILPFYSFYGYSWTGTELDIYRAYCFLSDIEKSLNYLDGHMTAEISLERMLQYANEAGKTRNIKCKFFDVTFYKKGTTHITFTCPELIDRYNIYCARNRNWLPPRYGRAAYKDMDAEEKAVIDSFHGDGTDGSGELAYMEVIAKSDYYLAPISSKKLYLPTG